MVDISEGIQFRRDGVDPSQWPKLSCSDANRLALEMSHLSLEADDRFLGEWTAQDGWRSAMFLRNACP